MSTHAEADAAVTDWQIEDYDEREGAPRTTRETSRGTVSGAIEGETVTVMLMTYKDDGTVEYVGQQRFDGTLDGRKGTFVALFDGTFEDGTARSRLRIVPGSGTGELQGITGTGTAVAVGETSNTLTLDYEL
jgi:hypothetical protein